MITGVKFNDWNMNRKEYRKKYYWEHREDSIRKASEWNKNNPDKRKKIYDKNNIKSRFRKRLWKESKYFNSNQSTANKNCFLCGSKKYLGIHHKDGNNGRGGRILNNKSNNLVVLCAKCHSAVHGWWGIKKI
jgi:hypothetical protein